MPSRKYHSVMDRDAYPSELKDRFILRLPEGMRERVADEAKSHGRSMNAEFVARLQASFDPAPSSADGATAQELADSRAQTIKSMAHLQRSLCESVLRLFATLQPRDQSDRGFREVVGMAEGLLEGTEASDFLLAKADLMETNPALAQFLEATAAEAERDKLGGRVRVTSQRPRRTSAAKR